MKRRLGRIVLISLTIYFFLAGIFFLLGGEQLHKKTVSTDDMVSPTNNVGELIKGQVLQQPFIIDADEIDNVVIKFATYERINTGNLVISIRDISGNVLGAKEISVKQLKDNQNAMISFDKRITVYPSQRLTLQIESDGINGNAVTVYYGNSISIKNGSVDKDYSQNQYAVLDGKKIEGVLCFEINGHRSLLFGQYFWLGTLLGSLVLIGYIVLASYKSKKGKDILPVKVYQSIEKYSFLLQQLIVRDFKTKYKRSILGVLWSLLNPMLMMAVYYVVFSTIFKTDIQNFPVYLIIGVVCFSFFNEATNMALMSIVGNASLITKVYIPKYIYPISKIASSSVNLVLSLIPMFIVILSTGINLKIQMILISYGLICLVILATGVGMLLSATMVFFRDTQFLWSIMITILNFATPIFYPESIINDRYMFFYKMNPLYHILLFVRKVLMTGESPEPMAYLYCFLSATVPLVIGCYVFKKLQDKFVLYL